MSYKVLVLIKPTEEQPALERAAEFARFMPDIQLVLYRVVREFTEDKLPELEQRYTREVSSLMDHYPSIKNYEIKIAFSEEVAPSFCNYAGLKSEHFDLAIISANRRNTLKDLFFSPIDSQIMRNVPIPLLIVKDPQAPQRLDRAIVLAIDFEESNHEKFVDEVLITAAKIFADNFNGEVHVLNCVPPVHGSLMGGDTNISIMMGSNKPSTRPAIHTAALYDFADKHDIPRERCHVAEGRVDEMIPRVCTNLEARMVCMGTSSREGVLSAFDQSASELVLEQIKGDIFIVNRHVRFDESNLHD